MPPPLSALFDRGTRRHDRDDVGRGAAKRGVTCSVCAHCPTPRDSHFCGSQPIPTGCRRSRCADLPEDRLVLLRRTTPQGGKIAGGISPWLHAQSRRRPSGGNCAVFEVGPRGCGRPFRHALITVTSSMRTTLSVLIPVDQRSRPRTTSSVAARTACSAGEPDPLPLPIRTPSSRRPDHAKP